MEGLSSNEGITREVYLEHMYAILEQDQLLLHSTHEQTEPECRILEEESQPNDLWRINSLLSLESKPERKLSTSSAILEQDQLLLHEQTEAECHILEEEGHPEILGD